MSVRHKAIGIKQTIRIEWMQKTVELMLSGMELEKIRHELSEYLSCRKSDGSEGERSVLTRDFAVGNLIKIWASVEPSLSAFRDSSLAFLRGGHPGSMAIHWAMISAAYPFWFNTAKQTGRLLALQEQVTAAQIIGRLKEQYGDRQTVSRYAQFVIRSFVAWGVLEDSEPKGCYKRVAPVIVSDPLLTVSLLESALYAIPEGKADINTLLNSPALFPFQLMLITGDFISQNSDRVTVIRYGLDEELLKLS